MSTTAGGSRTLQRGEWREFFDELTRDGQHLIELSVQGDAIGGTEVRRLPLDAVTYEDGDDQIAVAVGGKERPYPAALWHYVDKPQRVEVIDGADGPQSLTIVGGDGTRTVIRFFDHQPA